MGEVVAMDGFYTKCKLHNLMQYGYIELPKPTEGWSEPYAEFLVVNQMIPLRFKSNLFTSAEADGETLNLVTYIRFPPALGQDWRGDEEPCNAEQLLKRFLIRADQDANIAHCFKEIGLVLNTDDFKRSLPRALSTLLRFNGKPVLTRPQHRFYRPPDNSYFAVDLDGHQYTLTTRTAIANVIRHIPSLQLGYGMVVEARKEHEMPERMIFAAKLLHLSFQCGHAFPPGEAVPDIELPA